MVKKADFYVIANFQDLKDSAFDPKHIEEAFNLPTYAFSAIKEDAKLEIFKILSEILQKSILDKIISKEQT